MALVGTLVLAGGFLVAGSAGAHATTGSQQVCEGLDSGVFNVNGEQTSITVSAPEGKLISGYCVKAGSAEHGDGPRYVELDRASASVTLTYMSDGAARGISHYSLSYVQAPTTGGDSGTVAPTVQFIEPTCESAAGWAGYVDGKPDAAGDGVVFAVTSGTVKAGHAVTVTANAEAGFLFAGGAKTKSFTHTYLVPEGCDEGDDDGEGGAVTVTPTVQFHNPTCETAAGWKGFVDGEADAADDGVTFAVTAGTVAAGSTVTVTATADTGYVFAQGSTKTFNHTFTDVPEDCDGTGGDVQVVAPTVVFVEATCDKPEASWKGFVDGEPDAADDGVTFAVTAGTVAAGSTVTVTATADTGYAFAGGATVKTYEHTFKTIEQLGCDTGNGGGGTVGGGDTVGGGNGGAGTGGGGVNAGGEVAGVGQFGGGGQSATGTGATGADQGAAVLGAQSGVPVAVNAGVGAAEAGLAVRLAGAAVVAGLLLLVASGWLAFGPRPAGAHRA